MSNGHWRKGIMEKLPYRQRICRIAQKIGARHVAEIGVWRGMLSEMLIRVPSVERLLLVDPYSMEWKEGAIKGDRTQRELDERFATMKDKMRKLAAELGKEVVILRKTSVEAAEEVPPRSLDMVHIDGNHKYDSVRNDVLSWGPKIRPGGEFNGDDFNDPVVEKAVREVLPGIAVEGKRIWRWTIPDE